MLVDFIIAELLIWAVMVVLFPPVVAAVGALTRRMSLPAPRSARQERRKKPAPMELRDRALSTIARQRRRPMPSVKVPPRP